MIDPKLRERVDERRAHLKKALASAEPKQSSRGLSGPRSKLRSTEGGAPKLRNGWEHAAPEDVGQLHKWLGDTTNDVPK